MGRLSRVFWEKLPNGVSGFPGVVAISEIARDRARFEQRLF